VDICQYDDWQAFDFTHASAAFRTGIAASLRTEILTLRTRPVPIPISSICASQFPVITHLKYSITGRTDTAHQPVSFRPCCLSHQADERQTTPATVRVFIHETEIHAVIIVGENLSYSDRLLPTLQRRRLHFDLIYCYDW